MATRTEIFNASFKIDFDGLDKLKDLLVDIDQAAKSAVDSLGKLSQAGATLKAPITAIKKANQEVVSGIAVDLDKLKVIGQEVAKTVTQTASKTKSAPAIDVGNDVTDAAEKQKKAIAALIAEGNSLRVATVKNTTSMKEQWSGLSLAITTPGARLQGLREAFAGTASSGNIFVGALDKIIQRGDAVSKESGKLSKQMYGISEAVENTTRSMNSQLNVFRKLTQTELKNSQASDELDKQLTKVSASFKQIEVDIVSGRDIGSALNRAKIEVKGLTTEYKQLRSSGVVPAGSASDDMFKQIIRQARDSESRLVALAARYDAQKRSVDLAKQKQSEYGKELDKSDGSARRLRDTFSSLGKMFTSHIGSLGRLGFTVRGLFGGFGQLSSATNKAGQELGKVEKQVNIVVQGVSRLQATIAALVGGFAGVALGNIFGSLAQDVGGVLGAGAALSFGNELQNQSKQVVAALGGQQEEIGKIGNVIKDVYINNFGEGLTDIGQQVEDVTLRLGRFGNVSEDVLSRATQHVFRLKDAYPNLGDTNEIADAVALLISNFDDIKTVDDAFDFIAAGAQRGLNSSNDLIDTIREYTTQLSSAGGTAANFFNLLDTGLQGGVLGTDKAIDLFKEFRLRILDGSDTTRKGLTQIGIDYDQFTSDLYSGQTTVANAFQVVLDRMRGISDQGVVMQAGVALLGTQFEDLGDSAKGLSIVGTTIDEIMGATENLDLQYDTFNAKVSQLKRNIIASFDTAPIFNFLGAITSAVTPVATFGVQLISSFLTPLNGIAASIRSIPEKLQEMATDGEGVISSFASVVVSIVNGDWDTAWSGVLSTVDGVINAISGSLLWLVNDSFSYGFNFVVQIADGIIAATSSVITTVMNFLGDSIAAFTKPGSPPKEGPLSTIDEWGKGLIETYGDSMSAADFGFMKDVLSPIVSSLDPGELSGAFKTVESVVAKSIQDISDVGTYNQDALLNSIQLLPEGVAHDAGVNALQLIDAQQGVAKAQKKLDEVKQSGSQEEIDAAQTSLDQAKSKENELKKQITLNAKLSKAQQSVEQVGPASSPGGSAATGGGGGGSNRLTGSAGAAANMIGKTLDRQASSFGDSLVKSVKDAGNTLQKINVPLGNIEPTKAIDLKVREIASNIAASFNDSFKAKLGELPGLIKGKLSEAFATTFEEIKVALAAKLKEFVDFASKPENFGIAALGVGIAVAILGAPLVAIFGSIFGALVATLGFVLPLIGSLVSLLLEAATVGGLVLGIWLGWDDIVALFAPLIENISGKIQSLVQYWREFSSSVSKNQAFRAAITNIGLLLGWVVTIFVKIISLFRGPIEQIALGVLALASGIASLVDTNSIGSAASAADVFSEALYNITLWLWPIVGAISSFVDGMIQLEVAASAWVAQNLPGIIESLKTAFIGLFAEGRLGNEVLLLMYDLWAAIETIIPVVIAALAAVGIVVAGAINLVVSVVQAVWKNIGLVETFLTGIVQTVRGVIQFFTGLVQVIYAAFAAISAVFTGDWETARVLFVNGLGLMAEGIFNTFYGIVTSLGSVAFLIINTVSGVIVNFIANIARLLGYDAMANTLQGTWQAFSDMGVEIMTTVRVTISQLSTIFGLGIDGIIDLFWGMYDQLVGHSIIPDMVNEIIFWITDTLPSEILGWFSGGGIKNLVSGFVSLGADAVSGFIYSIKDKLAGTDTQASLSTNTDLTTVSAMQTAVERVTAMIPPMQAGFSGVVDVIKNDLIPSVASAIDDITAMYRAMRQAVTYAQNAQVSNLSSVNVRSASLPNATQQAGGNVNNYFSLNIENVNDGVNGVIQGYNTLRALAA